MSRLQIVSFVLCVLSFICRANSRYEEIDKILARWNTTYEKLLSNTKVLDDDFVAEDLLAVIPSSSSYKEGDKQIVSKTDVMSYSLNLKTVAPINGTLEGDAPLYATRKTDNDVHCTDDIVIQQRTFLLDELSMFSLLPYRSVAFVSCKTNVLPNISLPHHAFLLEIADILYESYVINAVDMKPNTSVIINDRVVRIDSLESSMIFIATSNIYLNIKDKGQYFDPAQFSYRSKIQMDAIKQYANTVPFSQIVFLQLYAMGTKLNISSIVSEEDRKLPSSFHDLVYCGNLKCDGGYFTGRQDTPYAFKRNDYIQEVYTHLSDMVSSRLGDRGKHKYRQLVSQKTQFENKVIDTGYFAPNVTAYVSQTSKDFGYDKWQNELPHELGHTYGLKQYSGPIDPKAKLLHYSLNFDLTVNLPFENDDQRTGSMNGGHMTGGYYTRLNRYSSQKAYAFVKSDDTTSSSSSFESHKFLNASSLLLVSYEKDFFLFKLNANVDTQMDFYTENDVLPFAKIELCVSEYNRTNFICHYLNSEVKRHQIPNEWLNSTNVLILKTNDVEKLFYLPNDAVEVQKPIYGIDPSDYSVVY